MEIMEVGARVKIIDNSYLHGQEGVIIADGGTGAREHARTCNIYLVELDHSVETYGKMYDEKCGIYHNYTWWFLSLELEVI